MRKGFTLIEILIVVAIIAILASVVLVGLGPTQQSGRDARRLSDLRQAQTALELYFSKCGFYPGPSVAGTCAGKSFDKVPDTWAGLGAILKTTVGIASWPDDPNKGAHYFYGTTGSTYVVGAILENKNNSVFSDYAAPDTTNISYTSETGGGTCGSASAYCITL